MKIKALILMLLGSVTLFGRGSYTGWCENGNQVVQTPGIANSTTKVQRSYPGCTITVYLPNGSLASIYSDDSGTVLGNPFTASSTTGIWTFFADQGNYNVTLSGANIAAPFTLPVTVAANSAGIVSLNGLTSTTQTFATGTSGTDFNISSSSSTHTFNLPTASAVNRGALSSTDWSSFNAKQSALTFTAPLVNTAGTVALTLPITIALGGTGQTTQTAGFDALAPTTTRGDMIIRNATNNVRLPVGTSGQCLTSNGTDAVWGTCINNTPVTVSQGGTGATTLTGIPVASGTSTFTAVAASSNLQSFRRNNDPTTSTYEFVTAPYLLASDYNFSAQTPGGSLTAALGASVTLTPCPLGVNAADTAHYLYISGGTGSAEAVLITGGSCTSGLSSGTITFTPANNHTGAWAISSATSGAQEAMCATSTTQPTVNLRGSLTLNANLGYCGKTSANFSFDPGVTFGGTGVVTTSTSNSLFVTEQRTAPLLFSQTSSVTVANTTSETTLVGSGLGNVTLPANFLTPGRTIKVRVFGYHSAALTPTIRIRIKFGSTTVLDTTAVTSANSTNDEITIEGWITCRSVGAMGTVFAQGRYEEIGNTVFPMLNTATTTIDTTTTQAISVTAQWGTASASDTITATNLLIEAVP